MAKPFTHEDLREHIQLVALPCPIAGMPAEAAEGSMQRFWGQSRRVREIQSLVHRISGSDAPALIEGETGAGREVLGREIHAHSRRSRQPFLKLNCAALPSELVESE